MTAADRNYRINLRNFYMVATMEELQRAVEDAKANSDDVKLRCMLELIAELEAENS